MSTPFKVAAIQMNSCQDKRTNLQTARRLIEKTARFDAKLIALPELFNCIGRFETVAEQAESIPGETSDMMCSLASQLGVFLLAGSIGEKADEPGKAYNTSLLIGPGGKILRAYRKMHLFDVDIPGRAQVRESRYVVPGNEICVTQTDLAVMGQAICYDLRFPELFRCFADERADMAIVPSAFLQTTGRDHWELLLRARAIENQCYVIGPNQIGRHTSQLISYGHSAIIDPWGKIMAVAENHQEFVMAEIDLKQMQETRRQLPALRHRRLAPRHQ